jgi:hypothetical protein
MASVVHYDYSAVLYLTSSSAAATSADDDGKNKKSRRGRASGFDGGTFVFCDGDADRTIVPREGRLVGFSSGKSEKTVSFCAIFAPRIYKRSFCQDRLGTNIGKTQNRDACAYRA